MERLKNEIYDQDDNIDKIFISNSSTEEKWSPIIDISTPESLERDFYAWLWSMPEHSEHSENESAQRSVSSRSSISSSSCSYTCLSVNASPKASPSLSIGSSVFNETFSMRIRLQNELKSIKKEFNNNNSDDSAYNSFHYTESSTELKCHSKNAEKGNNKCVKTNITIQSCNTRCSGTNQLGRTYSPGLPLSLREREKIVNLYRNGWKICDISKQLCVTHSCVSKILQRFRATGTYQPKDAKEGRRESPLVETIRDYCIRLGLTRQSQIREQLIRDGWYKSDSVPSRSSINHILRTKLDARRRKK